MTESETDNSNAKQSKADSRIIQVKMASEAAKKSSSNNNSSSDNSNSES